MGIRKIDHVGIALKGAASIAPVLRVLFPEQEPHDETVEDQGVRTLSYEAGESSIEFLESTRPDGPVGKFLERRGPGIHHIALAVDDLEAALADLKAAGIPLIDEKPRAGAGGKRIAFLHPKGTGGILIELTEG